jgi:hypothetical protein
LETSLAEEKYQRVILCYFDILGFRDLIKSKLNNPEDIFSTLAIARFVTKNTNIEANLGSIILNFSDTILMVFPSSFENKMPLVISNLASIQAKLFMQDILVRGSLTTGDLYIKKEISSNYVFGPALIKAYDLESKYAKHPRIIIDPEIINNLDNKDYLIKWSDDFSFVDYMIYASRPQNCVADNFAAMHKEVIVKNLANSTIDEYKKEKWIWLAKFHDYNVNIHDEIFWGIMGFQKNRILIA